MHLFSDDLETAAYPFTYQPGQIIITMN